MQRAERCRSRCKDRDNRVLSHSESPSCARQKWPVELDASRQMRRRADINPGARTRVGMPRPSQRPAASMRRASSCRRARCDDRRRRPDIPQRAGAGVDARRAQTHGASGSQAGRFRLRSKVVPTIGSRSESDPARRQRRRQLCVDCSPGHVLDRLDSPRPRRHRSAGERSQLLRSQSARCSCPVSERPS